MVPSVSTGVRSLIRRNPTTGGGKMGAKTRGVDGTHTVGGATRKNASTRSIAISIAGDEKDRPAMEHLTDSIPPAIPAHVVGRGHVLLKDEHRGHVVPRAVQLRLSIEQITNREKATMPLPSLVEKPDVCDPKEASV